MESDSMLIRAASEGNYEELCEILNSSHFDKSVINQALYQAVCKSQSASDHLRCVETLLGHSGNANYKDANGITLLMVAAKLGQIQLAELLINFGSSVEDKDKESRTPLMFAVESGYGDNVDVVKFLLEKKAKVNVQDTNGNSALHRSAEKGYFNSMTILLEYGAYCNAENKEKETPLHLACKHGFENCVEILLQKKAGINAKNCEGKTPVDIAPDHIKHIFELPQDITSDSSFCSITSSHNEIFCKICKKSILEGICKPCHDNNLQYNIQTYNENNKLIDHYAKEIAELKTLNVELNRKLKKRTENCEELKKTLEAKEYELKKKELAENIKEELNKSREENKELSRKIKDFEEEIESLKEQVINHRSESKMHQNETEMFRKRLEELKSKEEGMYSLKRLQKKTVLSYLKPYPVTDKSLLAQSMKEEISTFMQEIEKWQEDVEHIYSDLTNKIRRAIKKKLVTCNIELYGSYATKLHLPSSDIDMVITNYEGDKREILRTVDKVLRNQVFVKSTNLIHKAYVPVLKIRTESIGRVVQIDITVNDPNHSGIKCLGVVTRLLKSNIFIKPIFIILKQLLYICNFKEPFTGGLGSYSLFLMVASFVQKHQELCDKNHTETNVQDFLLSTLNYYADPNSYFNPIVTADPANPSLPYLHDRENYDFIQFIVVDPLNFMNNVAYNTHPDRLINIFRNAYYNIKRICLCDCALSNSPLYRMFYDTKENINS